MFWFCRRLSRKIGSVNINYWVGLFFIIYTKFRNKYWILKYIVVLFCKIDMVWRKTYKMVEYGTWLDIHTCFKIICHCSLIRTQIEIRIRFPAFVGWNTSTLLIFNASNLSLGKRIFWNLWWLQSTFKSLIKSLITVIMLCACPTCDNIRLHICTLLFP